jgi:hypothetical protein
VYGLEEIRLSTAELQRTANLSLTFDCKCSEGRNEVQCLKVSSWLLNPYNTIGKSICDTFKKAQLESSRTISAFLDTFTFATKGASVSWSCVELCTSLVPSEVDEEGLPCRARKVHTNSRFINKNMARKPPHPSSFIVLFLSIFCRMNL